MKIITYNTWHGLDGRGILREGELETPPRRARRLERQVEKLRELGPNVALLQEVNPLTVRLPDLRQRLSMHGVGQSDLCGIKFWGKGIPANLNSGLAILAREELKNVGSVQLSGAKWNFARTHLSFEISEMRYALMAELRGRDFGRVLIVNAHLHHGLEPNRSLLQALQKLADEKVIKEGQRAQIVREIEHAGARRRGEGRRLLDAIARTGTGYDGIILGGDFNAGPEADVVDLIKNAGFVDIVPSGLNTWDKELNHFNIGLSSTFSLPVSDFGIAALQQLLHDYANCTTRLDYLFVSEGLANRVRAVTLFGHDMPAEDMTSDHFGLVAEMS